MKTKSLTLAVALAFGALAMLATPAQAGGQRHYRNYYNNGWNNGWNNNCNTYGYYQRGCYQPVRYYQPVQYYRPVVYPRPFFQIGFSFGSPGCR